MSDFLLDSMPQRDGTDRRRGLESPPDPALVAAGWERRFTVDGRRRQEFVALYTELGYEVHVEPFQSEEVSPDCSDCRLIALLKFCTLYTRKRTGTVE